MMQSGVMLLLSASLLSLALHASPSSSSATAAAAERAPTAVRQLAPDAGEKILREHLAFAPWTFAEGSLAARRFLDSSASAPDDDDDGPSPPQRYRPAFANHHHHHQGQSQSQNLLRLMLLRPRAAACPGGMSHCGAIGQPNKCCQDGTTCTGVADASVGGIACCPSGASCGGQVGACPANAVSCPAELGGGCCIPGYVCQGLGCVPSASATPSTAAAASITTPGTAAATPSTTTTTITTTRTLRIDGTLTAVVITEIVAVTLSDPPATSTPTNNPVTATQSIGAGISAVSSVTGGAPWRPTDTSTQEGCPTGFYGCLATHGGGCCQTDRDCSTSSCPPQASTTIISGGRTVVVLASDVPGFATCALGWFLCGIDAGDRPGCCPSGYNCGTASCFITSASQTGFVQKEQPRPSWAAANAASLVLTLSVVAVVAACNVVVL